MSSNPSFESLKNNPSGNTLAKSAGSPPRATPIGSSPVNACVAAGAGAQGGGGVASSPGAQAPTSQSIVMEPDPNLRDLVSRLTSVAAAVNIDPIGPDVEWTARVAQAVLSFFGGGELGKPGIVGGPIGAWAAIVQSPASGKGSAAESIHSIGYVGLSPEQIQTAAAASLNSPKYWSSIQSGFVSGLPCVVRERMSAESVAPVLPIGASLRASVVVQPGAGFVSVATSEGAKPQTPRFGHFASQSGAMGQSGTTANSSAMVLVFQVDGRVGAWSPSAADTQLASLLATSLGNALVLGPGRLMVHRAGLSSMLSPSQAPILPLLAQGLSQRQIAARIGRSLHTVHDHVKGIYGALNVRNRYQLFALYNGSNPSFYADADD
jgi:DNA-binding CsgD family transcriptional regulator